ncbi:MAG: hypothetical protein KTR20_01320 [Cellvibrionaceae bacterium]|nr:hypothetical protein [Cellvibrionaceae bacterium]
MKDQQPLGPIEFDTNTDRSAQASMRIAKQDLEAMLYRVPNVLSLDPVQASIDLSHHPATAYGKCIWPDEAMLEMVNSL